MKTTLILSKPVAAQLKREAARQGTSMSELVEMALRLFFRQEPPSKLRPLPKFKSGGHLVNVDDRDALYDAMEGRR